MNDIIRKKDVYLMTTVSMTKRREFLAASAGVGGIGIAGCSDLSFSETWSTTVTEFGIQKFDISIEEGSDIRLTQHILKRPRGALHLALVNPEGRLVIAEPAPPISEPVDREMQYEYPDAIGGDYTLFAGYASDDLNRELEIDLTLSESGRDVADYPDTSLRGWTAQFLDWVTSAWDDGHWRGTWNENHSWDNLVLTDHFSGGWPGWPGPSSPQFIGRFLEEVAAHESVDDERSIENIQTAVYRTKLGVLHYLMRDKVDTIIDQVADLITQALRVHFGLPEAVHENIKDTISSAIGESFRTSVGDIVNESEEEITFVFTPFGIFEEGVEYYNKLLDLLDIPTNTEELRIMVPMKVTAEVESQLPLDISPIHVQASAGAVIETR